MNYLISPTFQVRSKIWPYISKMECNFLHRKGIDIGCGNDRISPNALGVDEVEPVWNCGNFRKSKLDKLDWISDKEYDYVYSSYWNFDLDNYQTMLIEWFRILKDDGLMFLYLPYKYLIPEHVRKINKTFTPTEILSLVKNIIPKPWVVNQQIFFKEVNTEVVNSSFLLVLRKTKPAEPFFFINNHANIGDTLSIAPLIDELKKEYPRGSVFIKNNNLNIYEDHLVGQEDFPYDGFINLTVQETEFGDYYRRSMHFSKFPLQLAILNGYLDNKPEYNLDQKLVEPINKELFNWH